MELPLGAVEEVVQELAQQASEHAQQASRAQHGGFGSSPLAGRAPSGPFRICLQKSNGRFSTN